MVTSTYEPVDAALGVLDISGPRSGYWAIHGLWLATTAPIEGRAPGRRTAEYWLRDGHHYQLSVAGGVVQVYGQHPEWAHAAYWLETADRTTPVELPTKRGHDITLHPGLYQLQPVTTPGEYGWDVWQRIGGQP